MNQQDEINDFIKLAKNSKISKKIIRHSLSAYKKSELYNYIIDASIENSTYIMKIMDSDFTVDLYNFVTKKQIKMMIDHVRGRKRKTIETDLLFNVVKPMIVMHVNENYDGFEDALFNALMSYDDREEILNLADNLNKSLVPSYIESVCIDKATLALVYFDHDNIRESPYENVKLFLTRRKKLVDLGCDNVNDKLVEMALKNLK